ncbi:MAG: HRDC domain-containing protein [candidate division Zixibacteria bacterium]|nr:HRDC domain-containing protein [candidate division Zixibacteria bacterium]
MEDTSSDSYEYVDSATALEQLTAKLERADRIAVDTEADSLHHYYQKVCLIQLSYGRRSAIVDPLAIEDLTPLLAVLRDKPLIFHSAEFDLRMLYGAYHFVPDLPVFDTMIAAQLLGSTEVGLVALAHEHLDVQLTKKGQKSDWSKRPLTDAQLAYACNDTKYLSRLADALHKQLARLNRTGWHEEACARTVHAATQDKSPQDPDDLWRIKGTSYLEPRHLVFVRKIWRWRDREAQKADLPPFRIMPNQLLLDLAVWSADHQRLPLEKGPRLPRHCTGKRLNYLRQALDSARSLPSDKWPQHRKSGVYEPIDSAEFKALRSGVARIARDFDVPAPTIASRRSLERITLDRPRTVEAIMESSKLLRWQAELVLPVVKETFSRKRSQSDGSQRQNK